MNMEKPRFLIKFNTGVRVHKPRKGKGSYNRKEKHGKENHTSES